MTEPGYVPPPQPGWWVRKDRVGTAQTVTDYETSVSGYKPTHYWQRRQQISSPSVGPQALRNKFRRKPKTRPQIIMPEFDRAGTLNSTSPATSWTWSHTLGPAASAILVVGVFDSNVAVNPMGAATCGGVAMDLLGHYYGFLDSGYAVGVFIYGLLNPPTGTQTIVVNGSTGLHWMNSYSYTNVKAFDDLLGYPMLGSVDGGTGAGTSYVTASSHTMTVPYKPNQLFVGVFHTYTTNPTSVTPIQRDTKAYTASQNLAGIIGEARVEQPMIVTLPAAPSTTGIAIPLSPTVMPGYGNVGAGAFTAPGTLSWSHTAKSGDYVLAGFVAQNPPNVPVCTGVTYGASAMTLLGSFPLNNDSTQGVLWIYGIAGVSAGTATITPTITSGSTFYQCGNSVSFHNASTATLGSSFYGNTSGAKTLAASPKADQLAVAFLAIRGAGSLTLPVGGAPRYMRSSNPGLLISTSSNPTNFGYTVGADNWAGAYVVLRS